MSLLLIGTGYCETIIEITGAERPGPELPVRYGVLTYNSVRKDYRAGSIRPEYCLQPGIPVKSATTAWLRPVPCIGRLVRCQGGAAAGGE